jgi:hypothetical protein
MLTDSKVAYCLHHQGDQDTGYPDRGVSWFSQSLQSNAGIVHKIRPRRLPATSFPFHHPIIRGIKMF